MKISEFAQRNEWRSGFFSQDILVNFDDREHKPILVLGYSGSGKTPVAQSLADQFSRELISTDTLWWELQKNGSLEAENKEKFYDLLQKIVYSEQNVIIEGVHLFEVFQLNQKAFLSLPLVLLGTNVYLSTVKAFTRDGLFRGAFFADKYRKNVFEIQAAFTEVMKLVEGLPKGKVQKIQRKYLVNY